jgi:hypothetical protein
MTSIVISARPVHESMEPNPPLQASSSSDSHDFLNTLWIRNVHNRIHKSVSLVPVLSHIYSVHITSSCVYKILFDIPPPVSISLRQCPSFWFCRQGPPHACHKPSLTSSFELWSVNSITCHSSSAFCYLIRLGFGYSTNFHNMRTKFHTHTKLQEN